MPLFHIHFDMTFYVTIGDTDYTVSISPEDGQPVVIKYDDKGKRTILPRPELGALLCEMISQHLQSQSDVWAKRASLYRVPALEV